MLDDSSGFGDSKTLMSNIYMRTLNKTSLSYENKVPFLTEFYKIY